MIGVRSHRALDQVVNSASSALYSVGLVAVTTDATLGAVAIAMTAQPLLLGLARTAVFEGLMMRAKPEDRPTVCWLPAATGSVGGIIAAVATVVVGLAAGLQTRAALGLAAAAAGVLVIDGLRFSAFLAGRDRLALGADLAWLSVSVTGLVATFAVSGVGLAALSWWYAIGAIIATTCFGRFVSRLRPGPIPAWASSQFRFGTDFVLQVVPGQAALILASAVSSFAAVGQLRAAVTLFNPLTTALYALRLTVLDRMRSAGRIGAAYVTVSTLYSMALIAVFELLPGTTARLLGAIPLAVLALTGVGEIGRHATQAIVDWFRLVGNLRQPLVIRFAQAIALLSLTVVLGGLTDATGLATARAIAFTAPMLVAGAAVLRLHRRAQPLAK